MIHKLLRKALYKNLSSINNVSKLISKYSNTAIKEQLSTFSNFNNSLLNSQHSFKGRIITIREYSNLSFIQLEINPNEAIQLVLSKEKYQEIKKSSYGIKTGQILSVSGSKIKTKTGADSLQVENISTISDCNRPIPKQYLGLKDHEVKYEKRYLDFLANPQNKNIILQRHKIINFLRTYMIERDFIEVETPILSTTKSGAIASPFITNHSALKKDLYLRVAPEIHLKKLIISGFNRIFEIGKNFRNEDISIRHNPEFSSCEFYAAYWDYKDLLLFTENFLKDVFKACKLEVKINDKEDSNLDTNNNIIDINDIRYIDTIEVFEGLLQCKLDFNDQDKFDSLVKDYFKNNKEKYAKYLKNGDLEDPRELINILIEEEVEGKIENNPTFILHHPISISPLAKKMDNYPMFTERFEVFLRKMEIINAYTELNDFQEQQIRFEKLYNGQLEEGDKSFVESLAYGMPPTAGWGIGLDRLIMILSNQNNIKDVIAFPIMNKRI